MPMYANSRIADIYDKVYGRAGLFSYEKEIISDYFPPGSRVLDIGCGTGRTSKPLAEEGYSITGIDISSEMIEKAVKFCAGIPCVKFHVCDMKNMRIFTDSSFDCAMFSFNGFSLVQPSDRNAALDELKRVLVPGGLFFFSVPYVDFTLIYWQEKAKKIKADPSTLAGRIRIGTETFSDHGEELQLTAVFTEDMENQLKSKKFEILRYDSLHAKWGNPNPDGLNETSVWLARNIKY